MISNRYIKNIKKSVVVMFILLALGFTLVSCNKSGDPEPSGSLEESHESTDNTTLPPWTLGRPKLRYLETDYYSDPELPATYKELPEGFAYVAKIKKEKYDDYTLTSDLESYAVPIGTKIYAYTDNDKEVYVLYPDAHEYRRFVVDPE